MKDIHITARRQKTEIKWMLGSFLFANLFNAAAIIIYKTSWKELYTQYIWVLIITVSAYAATIIIRKLYRCIKRLFTRAR